LEDVARAADGLLVEALSRLRAGRVRREAGYDGEYGVMRLFAPGEIRGRSVVAPLFAAPAGAEQKREDAGGHGPSVLDGLDPDQRAAAEIVDGPLLLVGGPGTGETRTLAPRRAHLIRERGVPAAECLAVTFSR